MSSKWLFARRYLLSRKSHSVINIIATVSLVAVAVPVAAMVVLMSVFNGFETLVKQTYEAVDADIEIRAAAGARSSVMEVTDENRARLLDTEGVAAVSYTVERQALLEYRDRQTTVTLRGVDDGYTAVVPIGEYVSLGSGAIRWGDRERILLGGGTAYALGVWSVTDKSLRAYALGGGGVGSLLPAAGMRSVEIEICGIFSIDSQSDFGSAIVPLATAQRLFASGQMADAVLIKTAGGDSPARVCKALQKTLGDGVRVQTREQKNSAFYRIMRLEKWAVFFVSALVLLIASLSIVGAVVMLIVEKRDEQTTLRSMGADTAFLRGIFVREGLLISGAGGVTGIVLGMAVVMLQKVFGFVKLPSGAFIIDAYPVELQAADLAAVFVTFTLVALLVSTVATRAIIKR